MKKTTHISNSAFSLKSFISFFSLLILISSLTAGNFQTKSGKGSTKQMLRLKTFNTTSPGLADETVIYFDSNATSSFDSQYDAIKLMNTAPDLPNLYSISNNNNYSINGQPFPGNKEITIALGLQINDKGVYQIEATEILNFNSGMQIYLIDMEKNITQNLNEISKYTFSYKTGSPEGRFFIKFVPLAISTGIAKLIENNMFNINKNGNNLTVKSSNNSNEIKLNVFNTSGQIIVDTKISSNNSYQFNLKSGAYIVRIISNNKAYTKKIIMN